MKSFVKTVLCFGLFSIAGLFPQAQIIFPETFLIDNPAFETGGVPLIPINRNSESHGPQNSPQISLRFPTSGTQGGNTNFPFFIGRNAVPITFPGGSNSGIPLPGVQNDANCPIQSGRMYYRGVCSKLLDTCDRNENLWLIVNQRGFPNCVQRSCPRGLLRHRGRCVKPDDPVCGVSEILYVEFTGQVSCDCEPNLLYDRALGQCLAEHRQGSCPDGQYLELQERQVACVVNKCPADNMVYNPANEQCYTKLFEGLCRKAQGTLKFNDMSLTATCDGVTTRNIFEVPALTSCPGGSKRDALGQCQTVFRVNSPMALRVPTQHSSRFSVCPPSYVRLPNGVCRKTNALFSG